VLGLNVFMCATDHFTASTKSPQGAAADVPELLIEHCRKKVKARQLPSDEAELQMCIERLSRSGYDGCELLARFFFSRFVHKLTPYADAVLDELRETDEGLVFSINNLCYSHYICFSTRCVPLRCGDLAGYQRALKHLGIAPPRGQDFGL
jgi:hypothetical protein